MIISRLIGGMGNQMFQYASGLALAESKGVPLYLDVRDFDGYGLHNGYELSRVFSGSFYLAQPHQITQVLGWRNLPLIRRGLMRRQMEWARNKAFVVAPHFHYWDGFFDMPDDCYLVGYWQSERYFKRIEPAIREAFRFHQPLEGKNAALAASIAEGDAVSLHVRRGDYVSDTKTNAAHGLCSLEYYREAILNMAEHVERPEFFVFSDDIAWVKANLKIDFPCRYVDHNQGAESYNDMRLMSLCRHHVIANSSFSWWGAWLNPNPDKIVVAPRKWFANDKNVEDLYPAGWVLI